MSDPDPKSRTAPTGGTAAATPPIGPEPKTPPGPEPACTADPVAQDILRGTSRMLVDLGAMPIAEFTLPNGRRADIAALGRDGTITIVEIKSSLADFRSDQKWPDYAEFCDRFYFAVLREFPAGVLPVDCGLILADRYGAEIVRAAMDAPALSPARRKALTLRFARTAALRLAQRLDPALSGRSEAKET